MISLKIAKQLRVKYLETYRDSQHVINQVKAKYEVKNEDLLSYYQAIIKIADSFDDFYISHVNHHQNSYVDSLAFLAATLALPKNASKGVTTESMELFCPKNKLEA